LLDYVAERDAALHALMVIAAFTGARRAQLLGLRWRNVDFEHSRLSFTAGWVEGPNGPVLTATKRNGATSSTSTWAASVFLSNTRNVAALATTKC
jgi:integrase